MNSSSSLAKIETTTHMLKTVGKKNVNKNNIKLLEKHIILIIKTIKPTSSCYQSFHIFRNFRALPFAQNPTTNDKG